mmetsp:Transcript_5010/g.12198  ORF Transcript_5010/g.12198 Transcript_5010/m.12198 type:complete len:80 (+) Transcript_5010:415-654(+)
MKSCDVTLQVGLLSKLSLTVLARVAFQLAVFVAHMSAHVERYRKVLVADGANARGPRVDVSGLLAPPFYLGDLLPLGLP